MKQGVVVVTDLAKSDGEVEPKGAIIAIMSECESERLERFLRTVER